jgi:hypothetical protein
VDQKPTHDETEVSGNLHPPVFTRKISHSHSSVWGDRQIYKNGLKITMLNLGSPMKEQTAPHTRQLYAKPTWSLISTILLGLWFQRVMIQVKVAGLTLIISLVMISFFSCPCFWSARANSDRIVGSVCNYFQRMGHAGRFTSSDRGQDSGSQKRRSLCLIVFPFPYWLLFRPF